MKTAQTAISGNQDMARNAQAFLSLFGYAVIVQQGVRLN
jgi:hypothetical protein